MRKLLLIVMAVLGLSVGAIASKFPSEWGIIKRGAFVIPSSGLNWADREGRAPGKRIGYLRVGTVVKVGKCRYVNGPSGSAGNYCDIQSENGVEGKILGMQIFPMERGKSYAVARQEIELYDRQNLAQERDKFSRNSGVIIEIVGDHRDVSMNENIDVVALYNLNRKGGLTKLSMKKADLVHKSYLVEYPDAAGEKPTKSHLEFGAEGFATSVSRPVTLWAYRPVSSITKDRLVNEVASTLGWMNLQKDRAQALIRKSFDLASTVLDRVRCVAEVKADVSTGFTVFGNGLKLSGNLPIYEKGKLFDIDIDVIEKDELPVYWVVTAKTVVCDMGATASDSVPRAIDAVSVMVMKKVPHQGSALRLTKEMPSRFGLQVPPVIDADGIARLFEIEKFQNYYDARRLILHWIAQTNLVRNLQREERDVLAHLLISKLAFFVRPSPDFD